MEILRALHLIFVVTWFSGLFYIVRLMIYHREAQDLDSSRREILSLQYLIMQRRLWLGITWPSAILTLILGLSQIHQFLPLESSPWLTVKLILVFLLYIYHLLTGKLLNQMKRGIFSKTSTYLRLWNEVATLFLVSIIFLVVLKSNLDFLIATLGFVLFSLLLMFSIKLYKKMRKE